MKNKSVWIGLAEVKPHPGKDLLGKSKGAFVNVVALAADVMGYRALVEVTMSEYDLILVGCEDITPLEVWVVKNQLHPELELLASGLTDEYPIQFGEFQSYRHDERWN